MSQETAQSDLPEDESPDAPAPKAASKTPKDEGERLEFQAEVSRLLRLMVHSVYSETEVFLRELISNASDACDKLRYEALTRNDILGGDIDYRIRVVVDRDAGVLTITDNGVGMDRAELIDNLGTIARSGTQNFIESLSGEARKDAALIGQFGVGFYSAFIVADRVRVVSRRAGLRDAYEWESDGEGVFTVREVAKTPELFSTRGSAISLHLREDQKEFLETARLRKVIKTYSDHIAFPIAILDAKDVGNPEAEAAETVNAASAIWMRPKSELSDEQYKEFYHHAGQMFDDPWLRIHYRIEGRLEYAALLFVPSTRPLDLFDPARKGRLKLYVKRVFITSDAGLLPPYLRFVRGVIDSEDMPLNLSREMLQNNPHVAQIKAAVTKRVIQELTKKAELAPDEFAPFWENFGAVVKEGIYEDPERRDDLLKLARFDTTAETSTLRALDDYIADMRDNQTAIYYMTGDDLAKIARSPHLEGYRARGVEVLLLSDPVDDFWITAVQGYAGKPFKSVTQGAADLANIERLSDEGADGDDDAISDEALGALIARMKTTLGGRVKDVRRSDRLTTSPVCLIADESGLDMHLERLLAQHRQFEGETGRRILEINGDHGLIRALAARSADGGGDDKDAADPGDLDEAIHLLLDQARIVEGESPDDPQEFAKRLGAIMAARFTG